jgi:FkbM family methyltransferase
VKTVIKKGLKSIIAGGVNLLVKTKLGRYGVDQVLSSAMDAKTLVHHRQYEFAFATPNALNQFRTNTFSTKEPETLDWIDQIPEGAVFWDIGANVGLYSCYAAKARNCRVFAFEPSVFNLELLARNIYLNDLVSRIVIVPIPLSNSLKVSTLNMTTTDWGGALSTFGENYGDDGKVMNKVFEFSTIGITLDEFAPLLNIPQPSHIKMDVDGLEHLILSGGKSVLQQVSELAIEVNEDFSEQAENVKKYCNQAGLIFREKRHSTIVEHSDRFGNTFNQFWYRPYK